MQSYKTQSRPATRKVTKIPPRLDPAATVAVSRLLDLRLTPDQARDRLAEQFKGDTLDRAAAVYSQWIGLMSGGRK